MRRVQIYLEEAVDDALEAQAAREGTSKAALIRNAVAKELGPIESETDDGWGGMIGWLDDLEPVDDIDTFLYGPIVK